MSGSPLAQDTKLTKMLRKLLKDTVSEDLAGSKNYENSGMIRLQIFVLNKFQLGFRIYLKIISQILIIISSGFLVLILVK